jgi:hypothetical protein
MIFETLERRRFILALFCLGACGKTPQIEVRMIKTAHVQGVSKFRSCCGHTYGTEEKRSMKHYFYSRPTMTADNKSMPVYAPFDGQVMTIEPENNRLKCHDNAPHGDQIRLGSLKNPNYMIRFFHVNPQVKVGYVKKGELLAYVDLRSCDEDDPSQISERASSFDISLETYGGKSVSIFDHMADDVLNEWKEVGITPENTKISKAERDEDPCPGFSYERCAEDIACLDGQDCSVE